MFILARERLNEMFILARKASETNHGMGEVKLLWKSPVQRRGQIPPNIGQGISRTILDKEENKD